MSSCIQANFLAISLLFLAKCGIIQVAHLMVRWVLPSNGRRLTLFIRGRLKAPCLHRDLLDRNLCNGGDAIMTDYEIIALVVAILGLLVSLLGIIVKLIIELIKAKK